MEIGATNNGAHSELDRTVLLRTQLEALRRSVPDREFQIVRDPASNRFVVQVLENSTGKVIDQFPAESILKVLSSLSSEKGNTE